MRIGTVINDGFDEQGYEHRNRLEAIAICTTCGKEVELWSDTEEWVKSGERWRHNQYGPSQGVCCGKLIVDSFDGCRVYDLEGKS